MCEKFVQNYIVQQCHIVIIVTDVLDISSQSLISYVSQQIYN